MQQYEVVPVYDLTLVRGAQLARQFPGRTADELGDLLGVEVHQASRDRPARTVAQLDRVARGELALDGRDARRQQRLAPLDDRAHGPVVEGERALRRGGVL